MQHRSALLLVDRCVLMHLYYYSTTGYCVLLCIVQLRMHTYVFSVLFEPRHMSVVVVVVRT
jgi:hypothetical protein